MHERLESHRNTPTASDRSFGVVFCVFFALIAGFQLYAERMEVAAMLAVASSVFGIVAFVRPTILAPLNFVWTRFGLLLHRIVNPIVMGLMFFGVFTPMGFAMRLFGFDPLRQRGSKTVESYWIDREPKGPTPDTMTKQF